MKTETRGQIPAVARRVLLIGLVMGLLAVPNPSASAQTTSVRVVVEAGGLGFTVSPEGSIGVTDLRGVDVGWTLVSAEGAAREGGSVRVLTLT